MGEFGPPQEIPPKSLRNLLRPDSFVFDERLDVCDFEQGDRVLSENSNLASLRAAIERRAVDTEELGVDFHRVLIRVGAQFPLGIDLSDLPRDAVCSGGFRSDPHGDFLT